MTREDIKYWLYYYGMPKEFVDNCAEQIERDFKKVSELPEGLEEAAETIALPYEEINNTYEHFNIIEICKILRLSSFKAGAKWQAEQGARMPKWKHPEAKYQYPEALTRIMDEYGDWHYGISEGHLNPDCEYISLAELSLMPTSVM